MSRLVITPQEDARLAGVLVELGRVQKNLDKESDAARALGTAMGLIEAVQESEEVNPDGKLQVEARRAAARQLELQDMERKRRAKREAERKAQEEELEKEPKEKPEEEPAPIGFPAPPIEPVGDPAPPPPEE